jgi:hypothetical protein
VEVEVGSAASRLDSESEVLEVDSPSAPIKAVKFCSSAEADVVESAPVLEPVDVSDPVSVLEVLVLDDADARLSA